MICNQWWLEVRSLLLTLFCLSIGIFSNDLLCDFLPFLSSSFSVIFTKSLFQKGNVRFSIRTWKQHLAVAFKTNASLFHNALKLFFICFFSHDSSDTFNSNRRKQASWKNLALMPSTRLHHFQCSLQKSTQFIWQPLWKKDCTHDAVVQFAVRTKSSH